MARLSDKVAIITGAARGMGAVHAKKFIENGAKVIVTDILEDEGKALVNELGENAMFIKHDVTSEEDWESVVAKAKEKFGTVDILVNNAGIDLPAQNIEDVETEQFRKITDINQTSVFFGMRAVAPVMKENNKGSIVNISSLAGIIGANQKIAYTASKFAVRGMTKAAALELGEFNIRVNSVHPGFIATDMTYHLINDELEQSFPLKRAGRIEEVSGMVIYLASDESSYSTGAEFVIDGGLGAQ
ncbi:glucose 1-dehydrogenase [Salinicoccus kekensis]|uniref:Diacetyl reductase [(S)-acetoin forming] n=1 Tax=Salinicoccus kekensis TaxID=714307 RepID=A0A285UFW4_9STAP|nr:glucose 1-dehydrogenase [Salinicoccus kekensis]SOC40729.1 3alpha(or 20beta)-hydroxysteroid dehydrogenase [Salinicoccus kekensis]